MTRNSSYESMTLSSPADTSERWPLRWVDEVAADLKSYFGCEFSLWDGETGELVRGTTDGLRGDEFYRAEMAKVVATQNDPQFIADASGVLLLAVPLKRQIFSNHYRRCVAIAPFVTRNVTEESEVAGAARLIGLDQLSALAWIKQQEIWTATSLLRLSTAVIANRKASDDSRRAHEEVEKIADNLAVTYEEITLIYGVTQNLRISSSDDETGRFALESLISSLPIQGAAIQLLPVAEPGKATYKARTGEKLVTAGQVDLTNEEFSQLVEYLELLPGSGPFVASESITNNPSWPFPQIRQMIIVPLAEGSNLFGWLAAINHLKQAEFSTVEASLMGTVGVMLGIHSGNRELYRRQAELLASVVRALTSAIDAKDPYTCGHSDRVARVAVRLAKELGKDPEYLNTIYMAGLLHDVGKIGIDERVLRKPDKLTKEEYEHIKLHPELGYRILEDIQQLQDVLPAVLHHHEQWDGKGYPRQLSAENIPEIARIMAVADAYDAMFSSRPYRPGMPEEKVENILRNGAGSQWDANVVDAYFRAREDIRQIGEYERANLSLDVRQWS